MSEVIQKGNEYEQWKAPATGTAEPETVHPETEKTIDSGIIRRWNKIHEKSKSNLQELVSFYKLKNPEFEQQLQQEIERIKDKASVGIFMHGLFMAPFLSEGRYRTDSEKKIWKERITQLFQGEWLLQRNAEKRLGILPRGSKEDPSIVYGALHVDGTPDRTDLMYGDCKIKLREDRIKQRAVFTYGDSFESMKDEAVTWDDALSARALMNLRGDNQHSYVEAQIMGGVTMEDVQEIQIPTKDLRENHLSVIIAEAEKQYPWVTFTVIETASKES